MKAKRFVLFVSTKKHPIKCYDMDAINAHYHKDPEGFNNFDKDWGHSLNIIDAIENGHLEFQKI